MLYRKRRRPRFRKGFVIIVLICFVFGLLIYGFEKKASVFSNSYIPSFAERCATEAINDAVTKKLGELNLSYDDLAKVVYSDDGQPKSIETNSAKINMLKAEATRAAQDEITKIKHSEVLIPLGAFTGLTLISNSGPDIRLTFCMTGSFNSHLESSFESAGINQTLHHIRLVVTANIVTASVDYGDTITFDTDFEVAQTVITGEIPTIYGGTRTIY
ncbi:sporulation protein YunB [Ruminococcus sp.]|uniref:sporulation protein YunB n=1 Tax=Ruminococcus sp. TaxID=41978 RepID=UPI002E77B0CA|nr:sporulation protein YunB [Ruminococcus sp.]MEE1262880.1 sporulation protein YunB [Ruminococcus sp.]